MFISLVFVYLYIFMRMSILSICVSMYCMLASCPRKSEEGTQSSRTGIRGGSESPWDTRN